MNQQPEKEKTPPTSEDHTVEPSSAREWSQEQSVDEKEQSNASYNGEKAQEELKIFQDKYLRLAAEFENYKRRAQRDQSDSIRFGNESLLKNLIPIIDNFERAIQCAKEAGTSGPLLEGVELTHKQFLEVISKLGVRQIDSKGSPFDPAVHQAVAQVEVDGDNIAPNTVVEELQKGYFLHDRILRPAMVTVAKEKTDQTEPFSTDESGEEGGIQA